MNESSSSVAGEQQNNCRPIGLTWVLFFDLIIII